MQPRYEKSGNLDGTTLRCAVARQQTFDFAWHYHREYELTLITEGSGRRFVGTTIQYYRPGDLVLVGPDLPHTFSSEPYAGMAGAVVAQFRDDFLGENFFAAPQFRTTAALLARSARGLSFEHVPEDVYNLLLSLPGLDPTMQTLALLETLHRLAGHARAIPITEPGYTPTPGTATRDRIDAVCKHLQQTHTAPISLKEVASLVHMPATSFSRFFHRTLGCTLTDYVNQLRVETACSLLINTDLPVTEIATRSGYQNLSNFHRRFRELKDMRPRDYRAAFRLCQ